MTLKVWACADWIATNANTSVANRFIALAHIHVRDFMFFSFINAINAPSLGHPLQIPVQQRERWRRAALLVFLRFVARKLIVKGTATVVAYAFAPIPTSRMASRPPAVLPLSF